MVSLVTLDDVKQALERVERASVEDANLVRAYIRMLESQIRILRMDCDDDLEGE